MAAQSSEEVHRPAEKQSDGKQKTKTRKNAPKSSLRWTIKITLWTFVISIAMSVISDGVLGSVPIAVAIGLLLCFIAFGILFDTIGMAVTTASQTPFHSMAAKKVDSAVEAISLIKNAEKVSNFCNDVVGDICGIVSGSTGAVIVASLVLNRESSAAILAGMLMTGLVSALTVGGKALGKSIAVKNCNEIVFHVAQVICFFKNLFKRKKRG